MMNIGLIIFITFAIVVIVGFGNLLLINSKTIDYVKDKYPKKWEDEIRYRLGGNGVIGTSIFTFFTDTDDPVIIDYKKKFYSGVGRLMLSVLIIAIIFFGYAVYYELTLPTPRPVRWGRG